MDIRREMESFKVDTRDRISQLPEPIIHHILSYLYSLKDLVRMSILSTYWFRITASFPNLKFNFFTFKKVIKSSGIPFDTDKDIRDSFFKYVEYTISRFLEHNVSVHTSNLNASVSDPTEVDIINRCLELTIKKGVKVLVISMLVVGCLAHVSHPRQRYRVPNILLTATSLTSLTLSYCLLPLSLMVDVVKFKCLKLLCLEWITLNEDAIKRLTTSCPLLEELIVKSCYGFKRLCVYGLLNLQQVSFCFGPEVERIEIDAPNLCYLCLNDFYETGAPPSINLASCKKLTRVCYQGKGLADLSSNFPFLEDLFLVLPDECERLNVSSHSLRTFMLHSKCELDKINVDALNVGSRFTTSLHNPKHELETRERERDEMREREMRES
ncbi:F-box domain containing protein [Tanacetum coccineum]